MWQIKMFFNLNLFWERRWWGLGLKDNLGLGKKLSTGMSLFLPWQRMHIMPSHPAHQGDICQLGLIGRKKYEGSRDYLWTLGKESLFTWAWHDIPRLCCAKLRQCTNRYRLSQKLCGYTVCQGTIKNHISKVKPQSITHLEKNKSDGALPWDNSQESDAQLQYLHLLLRVRAPSSVLPQELLGIFLFEGRDWTLLTSGFTAQASGNTSKGTIDKQIYKFSYSQDTNSFNNMVMHFIV